MIYVVATLTIKPGSLEALKGPAKACMDETRKEKGCISYELFASVDDPHRLVFIEKWRTREDLTVHSKTPHLAAWRDASAPHLVERRIEVVHPEKIEEF